MSSPARMLTTVDPGVGRRPPRAHAASDASQVDLAGQWRFNLVPGADLATDGFHVPGFDDGHWAQIEVPGHWQLQGHGSPAYTNVRYPFPVDPPFVPDENPTGEYRHRFELPTNWPGGQAVIRFLGVDSVFTAWLNGVELGWSTGSRLTTEFEVGQHLRAGANVVAVRVHQWSPASYLEDQDMWWLSGIFRDVSVISRPAGAIDDFFVHADFDHTTGRNDAAGGADSDRHNHPACRKVGPNQTVTTLSNHDPLGPHQTDTVGPHQAVRATRQSRRAARGSSGGGNRPGGRWSGG